MDWKDSFTKTVLLDLFPFHCPYLFKLKEFLGWLRHENEAMFVLFQHIKKSQMEAVVKYLNDKTSQGASGTPLLLTGSLSKACGKAGDKLFMNTVLKFHSISLINHPCSFIDPSCSPSLKSILANQEELDRNLSAVTGKVVSGDWFVKFADKNGDIIRRITKIRESHGYGGVFESHV